jgi:dCMP deaminase
MKTEEFLGSFESKSSSRLRQFDVAYMDIAKRWALLSYAIKKQVGAIIVKDRMIISDGFNGTPSKTFPNICEDEYGKTHWYTLHAESNAVLKLATSTQSSIGATLYITCSPCRDCAKLIFQSGIKRVVYDEDYKTFDGIDFLKKAGITVQKITEIKNNYTDIIDAFELEKNSSKYKSVFATIHKAYKEEDFDSIDKAYNVLLSEYDDNIGLLRAYLTETNIFKEKLKNRHIVYANAIQVCNKNGLNINEFLSSLK